MFLLGVLLIFVVGFLTFKFLIPDKEFIRNCVFFQGSIFEKILGLIVWIFTIIHSILMGVLFNSF